MGSSKKICPCGQPSVPGLISSVSLCQTHFDNLIHLGSGDAHLEAIKVFKTSVQTRKE